MYASWIHGPRILRAPENDQGADFEDDLDLDADIDLEDQDEDQDVLDEEDPDEPPEPAQQRRKPFAQRVEEVAERKARERTEALEREITALKTSRTADPRQAQEQAEDRQRRLAAMSPDQRTDFLLREQEQRFEARLAQTEFKTADAADAAEFRTLCANNVAAAKLSADVDKELEKMRANGQTAPRSTIFYFLLGKQQSAKAGKARQQQVNRAAAGNARNAARPAGGRSDVSGGDRRGLSEAEARRKRLEGLKF